jgi:hypothetical protein
VEALYLIESVNRHFAESAMLNVKYTLTRCHRVRDGQYATEASAGMSRFRSEIDLVEFIRD